jgi:2-iminobutanoate/2-iminopropanoate deaminase
MTNNTPAKPIGPYRPVVRAGSLLFTSGQLGTHIANDGTTQLVSDDPIEQLERALVNLEAVLQSEGATLRDVVKATLFVTDMKLFPRFNEVWVNTFSTPRPARSAIEVAGLPLGAAVEVEAIAYSS